MKGCTKRLFEEARQFAKRKIGENMPDVTLTEYSVVGFSLN